MLTPGEFVARVAEWIATYNRGSLDLPDGLLHKNAVFRLNGTAYEDMLGRPATDPLVRLVARGPAAYRLLGTAPWIMLALMFLGFAGAVWDAVKTFGQSGEKDAGK